MCIYLRNIYISKFKDKGTSLKQKPGACGGAHSALWVRTEATDHSIAIGTTDRTCHCEQLGQC